MQFHETRQPQWTRSPWQHQAVASYTMLDGRLCLKHYTSWRIYTLWSQLPIEATKSCKITRVTYFPQAYGWLRKMRTTRYIKVHPASTYPKWECWV